MTVWLTLKGLSASNKQVEQTIKFNEYAYRKKVSNQSVVVSKPKIDKLSFTVNLGSDEDHSAIEQLLWDVAIADDAINFKSTSMKERPVPGYITSVTLTHPPSGATVMIQAHPKNSNSRFFRFELNPDKLGMEGMVFFRDNLSQFLLDQYTYADLVEKAHVTRVDAAVDLFNIDVSDLMILTDPPETSHIYVGPDGKVETVYVGAKKGKAGHTTLYDKVRELEAKQDAGLEPDQIRRTRIERTLKPQKPMSALKDQPNPFGVVSLLAVTDVDFPENEYTWNMFVDSCRWRGIDSALALVPEGKQAAYSQALDLAGKSIWEPEKIWASWPAVIDKSGILEA